MAEDIDRKFMIRAKSNKNGNLYDESSAVLFLAKDKAFLATLPMYRTKCIELGADAAQIESIDLLIKRVEKYQAEHPELAKVPDADRHKEAYLLEPNA